MKTWLWLLFAVPQLVLAQTLEQLRQEYAALPWIRSGNGTIAGKATIVIPPNSGFLDSAGTRRFLVLQGNPPADNNFALVPGDQDWFAVFAFNPVGYVKDDDEIDADALMDAMKERDKADNEERRKLGLPELHLDGWYVRPNYDAKTKRLEWGTRLRDAEGNVIVNYTSRLLGRTGVMSAVLVTEPAHLDRDRQAFGAALQGFTFVNGERYSEWTQGDKVAAFGLGALVAGGAAAAAAKTAGGKGFVKAIGIAALAGVAAVWGFAKRFFARKKDSGPHA